MGRLPKNLPRSERDMLIRQAIWQTFTGSRVIEVTGFSNIEDFFPRWYNADRTIARRMRVIFIP